MTTTSKKISFFIVMHSYIYKTKITLSDITYIVVPEKRMDSFALFLRA